MTSAPAITRVVWNEDLDYDYYCIHNVWRCIIVGRFYQNGILTLFIKIKKSKP